MQNQLWSNKIFRVFIGKKCKNIWIFSILILLSAAAALLEGTSFGFLALGMSGLQSKESSSLSLLENWINLPRFTGLKLFFYGTFLAIFFQISRSAVNYFCTICAIRLATKIQNELQSAVYKQILKFTYGYITKLKIGEILEIAKSPANFINPLFDCLLKISSSLLTSIVILLIMFQLNISLATVTIALFLLFGLIQKSILRIILKSSDTLSKNLMVQNQEASQILQGIKVIQTFYQQDTIKSKLDERTETISKICKTLYTTSYTAPYINEIFSVLIIGSILTFSIMFVGFDDSAFISVLITFLAISYRLSSRLQIAIGSLGYVGTYYGQLLRTNEILKDEDKEFISSDGVTFNDSIQDISLNSVSFCYHARNENVLKNVSFSITKGSFLGIVGLSGSGKSSLIDLLLRLYEPTAGCITVNGIDIKQFSLASWRAKFGVVAQDSFLFDDTIVNNIRFGLRESTIQQVIEAAKAAEIDDFIRSLPNGYETTIGERGLRLSGGERQRIALARALLRDPEVLILDEATSNLDSKSESYIQKVLEKMRGKKTVVMIAHRLSTIMNCDSTLVIEKGTLIEQGNHDFLLKSGKRYTQLWSLQTMLQNHTVSNH